jgi:hypothetical protein
MNCQKGGKEWVSRNLQPEPVFEADLRQSMLPNVDIDTPLALAGFVRSKIRALARRQTGSRFRVLQGCSIVACRKDARLREVRPEVPRSAPHPDGPPAHRPPPGGSCLGHPLPCPSLNRALQIVGCSPAPAGRSRVGEGPCPARAGTAERPEKAEAGERFQAVQRFRERPPHAGANGQPGDRRNHREDRPVDCGDPVLGRPAALPPWRSISPCGGPVRAGTTSLSTRSLGKLIFAQVGRPSQSSRIRFSCRGPCCRSLLQNNFRVGSSMVRAVAF